MSGEERRLLHK